MSTNSHEEMWRLEHESHTRTKGELEKARAEVVRLLDCCAEEAKSRSWEVIELRRAVIAEQKISCAAGIERDAWRAVAEKLSAALRDSHSRSHALAEFDRIKGTP